MDHTLFIKKNRPAFLTPKWYYLRIFLLRYDNIYRKYTSAINGRLRPASWLFRIAANICLSYLRTQAIRNQLQDKVLKSMPPSSYPVAEQFQRPVCAGGFLGQLVRALPRRKSQFGKRIHQPGLLLLRCQMSS
jgi:hypothetical protein